MRTTCFCIILLLLYSCTASERKKVYENQIPLTKELLVHEWMADSIDGSSQFVQDWIYFSPDNKFWRLSYFNESYVTDSSLEYKDGQVFKNCLPLYSFYSKDSTHLLLVTTGDTVLHLKRRKSFDTEWIERMISANPQKLLINGTWKLDSSDYSPAYMPSYCSNLYPGSRFVFKKEGILEIQQKDSINKCYGYSYKIFGSEIGLVEYDMVISLDIIKLTADSLVLKSSHLDYNDDKWTDEVWKAKESGYHLYFTKVKG